MFLEKQIKDDFNTFYPVKFENEKAEDDHEHFEDDYERIEQKKKDLIDHIYTRRIDRHYNPPNSSISISSKLTITPRTTLCRTKTKTCQSL
jgi:hypothetical protein